MATNDLEVKVPVEVINFCEWEAIGQILSDWDDRFSPEQIVESLRELGNKIPDEDNLPEVVVWGGFDDATGEQLANQFDDFFEAFMSVARLTIVQTRLEVKNV
jgi:hypothetical protein